MQYAPIVLFTYNRADTTRVTLEALMKNPECKDSDLFIFSDAAKTEKAIEGVDAVRRLLASLDVSKFHNVKIVYQEENQGLAKSIINGVTAVLEKYDRVIVLEDDCEVSPYYLNYINKALEYYKDSKNIGSITGFMPNLETTCENDVCALPRSCSYGWATWKKVWECVNFFMPEYNQWRKDKLFIRQINRCGNDRMCRLIKVMRGKEKQSWSVRFGAYLVSRNLLTIYPKYTYLKNNGFIGGGEHSSGSIDDRMQAGYYQAIREPVFIDQFSKEKNIERQFRRIYGGNILQRLKKELYILFFNK
ncbi:MAG: glycosyltransferase family 2 protein [Clostridiales bacterium]|nr:glycosyltransferase family 2 protein [Clostridiales bacterium]